MNILSMSFGFPREPVDGEFKRILVEATTNEGVLISAASSNHGANGGIPFPASLSGHVFGINSADAYATPATYSTVKDEHGYNFTALGEGVQGLQSSLSPDERPPTVSGSSIAAPIAAGIASLILEFCRQERRGNRIWLQIKHLPGHGGNLGEILPSEGRFPVSAAEHIAQRT